MRQGLVLTIISSHLFNLGFGGSCNYGFFNSIFLPEEECSYFVDFDDDREESYMMLCDYSSGAQGYVLEFNDASCSGTPNITTLTNFYCCESCIDVCDSYSFAAIVYGNDSLAQCSGTPNDIWAYTLYAGPESETCTESDGYSVLNTYDTDLYTISFYFNPNCSGSPFFNFEFVQGCNYMAQYNGYVQSSVGYTDEVTTMPETTIPESTIPEPTIPETTIPVTTMPETTMPETTDNGGSGGTTTRFATLPETSRVSVTASNNGTYENPDLGNCKYGASGATVIPADTCGVPYSPYNNLTSWKVVCDGSQAFLHEYSNDACDGTPRSTESLTDFNCCDDCSADECDIVNVKSLIYENSTNDCSGDIEYAFDLYSVVFDGCFTSEGLSWYSIAGSDYWYFAIYFGEGCTGTTFFEVFFVDGDCDYYDIYQTYLNVDVTYSETTGTPDTTAEPHPTTTRTIFGTTETERPFTTDTTDNPDFGDCNYGVTGSLAVPAGVCSIPYSDYGDEDSWMVVCDYSGSSPQAYQNTYNNADCSGTAVTSTSLTDFRCCETCDNDECEIASVRALIYEPGSCTDIEYTFDIEALVFDGCYTTDDDLSFTSEVGSDYWAVTFYYGDSGCSGSLIVSYVFTDGDCDYYYQYNTTLNVDITVEGDSGSTTTGSPFGPTTTRMIETTNDEPESTISVTSSGDFDCNYGFINGLVAPEGSCSIPYSPYGNETSWEMVCDYSGTTPQGHQYVYNNGDCSGSPVYTEELNDFRCCETCDNECETASIRALIYAQNSSDCSTDIEYTFDIESLVFDGCYNGVMAYGEDNYFVYEIFGKSNCSDTAYLSIEFIDADCMYYDLYGTTLNVEISFHGPTGEPETSVFGTTRLETTDMETTDMETTSVETTEDVETTPIVTNTVNQICSWGYFGGLLMPPDECIVPYNEYNGDYLRSWLITCDFSGTEPQAYIARYSNDDCSGTATYTHALWEFYCCEDCIAANCDTFELAANIHGDDDDDCSDAIEYYLDIPIYQRFAGCYNPFNTTYGLSVYQGFAENVYKWQVFGARGCHDEDMVWNFTFVEGCHYMDVYAAWVESEIEGYVEPANDAYKYSFTSVLLLVVAVTLCSVLKM